MKIIDTIKTAYKELFIITLLHPAYEAVQSYKEPVTNTNKTITISSIFNVLSIEPDAVTKKLFESFSVRFRNSNNTASCFIRTQLQQPFIKLPADVSIRLLIKQKGDFLYQTNITAAGSRQVYRFTNTNNTVDNGLKHLTKNAVGANDDDLADVATVAPEENCLGVIDIFNNVTDTNYRLLDGNNLESPAFVIRFIKK